MDKSINESELEFVNYLADETIIGIRVDKALAILNSTLSRSQIQKYIEEGYVEVNSKSVKSSYKIEKDDEITLFLKPLTEVEILGQDIPLDIVYEDNDLIVINKPQGMVVHPAVGHHSGTLVNALMYHFKELSSVNGGTRPGIVHRLDKDTSGLIIVCKNDTAHNKIASQLLDKSCGRVYVALVHGIVAHEVLKVDARIGRHPTNRQKMCVISTGKEAVTNCKLLKRYSDVSLVECHLETGRTHQIRVHLSYIKHPVVDDPVYGTKKTKGSGQLLHAKEISFIHPTTNKKMTFSCDLPEHFKKVLEKLDQYGTWEKV